MVYWPKILLPEQKLGGVVREEEGAVGRDACGYSERNIWNFYRINSIQF